MSDGDSLRVEIGGRRERVRLIGIGAPELANRERGVEAQCGAEEARAFARRLLPEGALVRLRFDVERRDRHGRLLAYVFTRDGRFVNGELVAAGFATPLRIAPNTARAAEFDRLARDARRARRGLHLECA